MTKELVDPKRCVEHLRERIKKKRSEMGGSKALYLALYGKAPVGNQNQTFVNLINRGSLKAEFIALCAERFEWHDVTLGELFSLPKK
ncbi:hypothetical protein L1D14_04205 [Vibrio tubiashii]|uniref:hypothetical protein n=1 Tax=Vibrio tubiashii TaxID=29498 RepID=UPI001EFCD2E7|nr:hypothetical protein [Vibrio tubiashii]MCG9575434.1 hypothetical protein [Vibrio tubiashii]